MRAIAGLAPALLLFATSAAAQGLSGDWTLRGQGYVTGSHGRDPDAIGWATFRLKEEAHRGRLWLQASARAELITSEEERGKVQLDLADRGLRRSPLSLRELALRLSLARALDLHAGRLLLGWGKTDGYSPADAFLPRDLSDPFADEKLPLWGVRLTGQQGAIRFDGFAAAVTTPWRLPVLSGRYAPLATPGVHLVDGVSRPPATGFVALRLLGTWGPWDIGGWGRAGVRPAPLLVFRPDLARVNPAGGGHAVPADRRYAHEDGAGIEAARVAGGWVLRAELGALASNAVELGAALLATAGIEHRLAGATLLVTLAANLRDTPVEPALLFDRAFLPGIIVAWSGSEGPSSWRLVYSHGFDHGDGLLKAEASYALDDVWALAGGIDWPRGSRAGPLGALRDARRGWAALSRRW